MGKKYIDMESYIDRVLKYPFIESIGHFFKWANPVLYLFIFCSFLITV